MKEKEFEDYLAEKEVRKATVDYSLARALLERGKKRLDVTKSICMDSGTAPIILEDAYDALREAADSQLAVHGFKSYSHIASIIFLKRFKEFSAIDIKDFDILRVQRNQSRYYAEPIGTDDAEFAVKFAERMLEKLKLLLEKQLGGNNG